MIHQYCRPAARPAALGNSALPEACSSCWGHQSPGSMFVFTFTVGPLASGICRNTQRSPNTAAQLALLLVTADGHLQRFGGAVLSTALRLPHMQAAASLYSTNTSIHRGISDPALDQLPRTMVGALALPGPSHPCQS